MNVAKLWVTNSIFNNYVYMYNGWKIKSHSNVKNHEMLRGNIMKYAQELCAGK